MAYIDKAKDNTWPTPSWLFEDLNREFNFTVDVASSDENCLCEKHYTEQDNGLEQNWGGRKSVLQSAL